MEEARQEHSWLGTNAHRPMLLLGALVLASALTEGIGLLLLVPLLSQIDGSAAASPVTEMFEKAGFPLELEPLLALFVALVILRALIGHARLLAAHRLEVAIVDTLRDRAWTALLNCDWRTLSAMRQSDNATLLVASVDRIGDGVNQLLQALAAAATLVALGLAALAISPVFALAGLAGGALVLFAYRGLRRRAHRLGDALGESHRAVIGDVSEGLGALRIIKSFGAESRMAASNRQAFAQMRSAQRAFLRQQGLAQAALQAGGAILLAVLVWLALEHWDAGTSQILPLVALFARALPLLGNLQQAWQNWAHARPAIGDAMELIEKAETATEPVGEKGNAPRLEHAISLEAVSLRFDGRDHASLDTLTLELPARSTTAITGPSGAGKSTLGDILGGLLSPDAGDVRIDGRALDSRARRNWRSSVAYVQQEPVLFSGSVRDNLLWAAPEADEPSLRTALEQAAAQFVFDLPGGMDCPLGDGGRQLSGGERQRIALARALLRQPQLLILDEATSALDPESEASVAAALGALSGKLAIVVICHRGALQDVAGRVVRLEKGRLADDSVVSAG